MRKFIRLMHTHFDGAKFQLFVKYPTKSLGLVALEDFAHREREGQADKLLSSLRSKKMRKLMLIRPEIK